MIETMGTSVTPPDTHLAERVGQMLLFGWQGADRAQSLSLNEHAGALIDDAAVGGVILMGRNVDNPEQLKALIGDLQARNRDHDRAPLFIAVDQEGGRVNRLMPPHFTTQPSSAEIGATGDPQAARDAAVAIAAELRPVGINWNFAPVLDVNNNPLNPVIGDRSFGDDPGLVAAMGVAAVRGYQDECGLLACGKHFPGHGDTTVDSHLGLPVVAHQRARLDNIELVPFRATIAAGLAAIMTAHIMFTKIDPAVPATLSHKVLTGLLRHDMGFDGLIITDCLEMKGITGHWDSAEAAVRAVEAGADILLCCHTWTTQAAIHAALCDAVATGRISTARIDESLDRIARAKERWLKIQEFNHGKHGKHGNRKFRNFRVFRG
jgi:beta-N-acetylhexosaminidase